MLTGRHPTMLGTRRAICSLAALLQGVAKMDTFFKSLIVFHLCQHKLIRKNYIHQDKQLFKSLLKVVTCPGVCRYDLSNISDMGEFLFFMLNTNSFGPKQFRWLLSDNDMMRAFEFISELSDTIMTPNLGSILNFYRGLAENSNNKQKNKINASLLNLNSKGMDTEKICIYMKDLQKMTEQMRIECGNIKCKRDYLFDKYNCKFIRDTDDNMNDLELAKYNKNLWKNKKRNETNAWKICKGCKAIYFCSRKCQKIAWKFGHAGSCKILQIFGSKISNQ